MGHRCYNQEGELIENAGIKEMRENRYVPTVTSIIALLNNPFLEVWKQKNVAAKALELPADQRTDDLKADVSRVLEDSRQIGNEAASRGTEVHDGLQAMALGQAWNESDQQLIAAKEWMDAHITRIDFTERTLINHELGYAGTCDLKAEHEKHGTALFDYKTQGCKAKGDAKPRPNYYTSWPLQLAAYLAVMDEDIPVMSVVIDKNSSHIFEKRWPDETITAAYEAFKCLHHLWCWQNNYWPGK